MLAPKFWAHRCHSILWLLDSQTSVQCVSVCFYGEQKINFLTFPHQHRPDAGHVILEAIFSCEGRSPAWQLTLEVSGASRSFQELPGGSRRFQVADRISLCHQDELQRSAPAVFLEHLARRRAQHWKSTPSGFTKIIGKKNKLDDKASGSIRTATRCGIIRKSLAHSSTARKPSLR